MFPDIAPVELLTPRLLLRPYRDGDALALYAAAREECLARNRMVVGGVPQLSAVYSLIPGDLD